jgi:hypothetical protein
MPLTQSIRMTETELNSQPVFKIFNLDLHVSVIEDFKNICKTLYGSRVEITNWSLSGHNWVFNKPTAKTKILTSETWFNINKDMITAFQKEYEDFLQTFDAFVVTHSPVFALLFEKYQKPILIINSCRYNLPYCWTDKMADLEHLNTSLVRMFERKQIVIVSNNAADQHYIMSAIPVYSLLLPSLCQYIQLTHVPQQAYFLCYGKRDIFASNELLHERPENFSWRQLMSYRGIVHTPYEMSTMSIFEQFWAGVPLFFPTKRYYIECVMDEKMDFVSIYWKHNNGLLTEEDMLPWLDRADFYRYPFIHYYDSEEDLFEQLANFEDTHRQERMEWIATTKHQILDTWREILKDHFGLHHTTLSK